MRRIRVVDWDYGHVHTDDDYPGWGVLEPVRGLFLPFQVLENEAWQFIEQTALGMRCIAKFPSVESFWKWLDKKEADTSNNAR